MAKAVQTVYWDIGSILWATLANANRDEKTQPRPFNPADIHPFRTADQFTNKTASEPDWATIKQIRKQYKRTKLTNGSQSG